MTASVPLYQVSYFQVYVYSDVEYDRKKVPDIHGTILTDEYILAKGTWHMAKTLGKNLLVVKVKISLIFNWLHHNFKIFVSAKGIDS